MVRIVLMACAAWVSASNDAPLAPAKSEIGATRVPAPARIHLPEPAKFPAEARHALDQRMNEHANELEWLLSAALMLNYDLAAQSATNLADDPKLAPPSKGDLDTLNSALPKKFFVLQAQLAKRARAVAVAAKSHDDRELGRAIGNLTETCVACHSVYLYSGDRAAGGETENP